MSGLLAVIATDDAPVTEEELTGLVGTYERVRGGRGLERAVGGDRVRAVVLGLDGAPRNTAGIERGPEGWIASVHSTRQPRLADQVGDLDGQFAGVRYDGGRDEVEVLSDPFGMQVLFVAHVGGRLYVSTSSLVLARHLNLRPSPLGLKVYLLAGSQFGTRTLWEGLERVDPATRLVVGPEGTSRSTYWRLAVDERFSGPSIDKVADACVDVLLDSVRVDAANLPPAWCDITSGLDSRLLVLAARGSGAALDLSTSGLEDDPDVRVGRRIAETMGLDWLYLPRFPGTWPDVILERLPRAVAWGEGTLDAVQLGAVLYRHALKRQRHDATITGGGGEHFRVVSSEQEWLRAGRTTKVNYENWLDYFLLYPPVSVDVFAADPRGEVRDDLRSRMAAWASPYADLTNDVQLEALFVYKQMGHFGAYYSAARPEIHAALPYYRKSIVGAGFSVPYAYKRGGRLERRMIERLDPKVAAIPLELGGVAAPMRPTNVHRFVPAYARRTRKLLGKVADNSGLRPARPAPPAPPALAARRAVIDELTQHGRPPASWNAARLFDVRALERLVADGRRAGFTHGSLLGRITTVELALRAADASL